MPCELMAMACDQKVVDHEAKLFRQVQKPEGVGPHARGGRRHSYKVVSEGKNTAMQCA